MVNDVVEVKVQIVRNVILCFVGEREGVPSS
jgi:hypothetical protein